MSVEVTLFGFGTERPRAFGTSDQLMLPLQQATTIAAAFSQSGLTDPQSLSAILNGTMVPRPDWESTVLADGDELKVLMAIEGG